MRSEDTAYMARVNAAVWLIRKAGKIARRLNGTTPEQRQAVEDEIVAIGQRMYDEMRQVVEDEIAAVGREMYGDTRQQPQPEVTPEPGGDYQLGLYASDVVELDASVDMWFIENDYNHKFTPEQTVRRWRNHVSYSTGQDHELEEYIAAVVDQIAESTHDPGEDRKLEAYVAAVRDLVPDAERLIFERYQDPRLSPAELAERWQAFRKELEECRKQ